MITEYTTKWKTKGGTVSLELKFDSEDESVEFADWLAGAIRGDLWRPTAKA
jgi:hypothetical protein